MAVVEDLHHVGVIEHREGAGLTLEALGELRDAGQLGVDDLDGHHPVQLRLPGLVDHSHASSAQWSEDFHTAEGVAGCQWGRGIAIVLLSFLLQHPGEAVGTASSKAGGEVGLVGLPAIGAGALGLVIHGVLVHFTGSLLAGNRFSYPGLVVVRGPSAKEKSPDSPM